MCFDGVLPGARPGPPEVDYEFRFGGWSSRYSARRIPLVFGRLGNCVDGVH